MKLLQVRDYRKCASEQGSSIPATDVLPVINKVRLRMSLENVVKDIPFISDNSWTYGDLMVRVVNSSCPCKINFSNGLWSFGQYTVIHF